METVIQEIPELIPFYITLAGDTVREEIYVPIAITQKEYETDSYRAWVSGYKPSLDSIWVYPERIYIKEKARRWGIGVSAGYGIGRNGLSPYVGVGCIIGFGNCFPLFRGFRGERKAPNVSW